jgi:hypothetical protein
MMYASWSCCKWLELRRKTLPNPNQPIVRISIPLAQSNFALCAYGHSSVPSQTETLAQSPVSGPNAFNVGDLIRVAVWDA